jgi:hypothetical protein
MDTLARMATGFFLMVNTILMVFVCNMLLGIRSDLRAIGDVATRQDILSVVPATHLDMPAARQCTRCHTESRFANLQGTPDDLVEIVRRMQSHPDANIGDEDVVRIQASLTLLKCTICHDSQTLRQLSLMGDEQQLATIRTMQEKHGGPAITREEARQIQDAYKTLIGKM